MIDPSHISVKKYELSLSAFPYAESHGTLFSPPPLVLRYVFFAFLTVVQLAVLL